jgi:cell division protein ZapA
VKGKGEKVQVKIFGQEYTLRGEADAAYAQELAGYVDRKMQEVTRHSQISQTTKIAILAAINIAHELFDCRARQKEQEKVVGERTKDIIESIEEQFEEFHLEFPSSS